MVVIAGICLVAQADVVRYRPLLLVLAAGKTASSLAALGFYLFDQDVFIYLLNFLVDGFLALRRAVALVARRAGSPRRRRPAEGARRGSRPPSCGRSRRSARRWRPATTGCRRPSATSTSRGRSPASSAELPPRGLARLRLGLRAFELLPFPWRFSRLDLAAREDFLARMEGSRLGLHHELLLMAKVLCTLGYAIVPEVRERVGYEVACALADGQRARAGAARWATRSRLRDGEDCDVVDRRLGRRRRGRGGDPGRGGARRDRARGGRPLQPRQLPERSDRRRSPPSTATPGSPSPRAARRSRSRSAARSAARR